MRAGGLAIVIAGACTACASRTPDALPEVVRDVEIDVAPAFDLIAEADAATLPGCPFASPVWYEDASGGLLIAADSSGTVTALSPASGAPAWQTRMPAPDGEDALVLATPVLVGELLVVAYHTTPLAKDAGGAPRAHEVTEPRLRQRVAVLTARDGKLARDFPAIDLHAELPATGGGTVTFLPGQALARGALAHLIEPWRTLGLVYVSFGNARDLQPWHGWAFELDLDAWRARGADAAISAALVTTPEANERCGAPGHSGSRERRCGGGLWSPSGPLVLRDAQGPSLILAAGNGQLDLARGDHANSLMRVRPGLAFVPACDPVACARFEADAPAEACLTSCRDLFVPRPHPGEAPPQVGSPCAGLTLFQCWEKLDYGGGSSPERVVLDDGLELLVHAEKDGSLALIDAAHLGTQYDRTRVVEPCGTESDPCTADWAGMIVTRPTVARGDDGPIVLVPTFMPDATHPAGVVAFDVLRVDGAPRLRRRWEYPRFDAPEAVARFRLHPSRAALIDVPGHGALALVVEPGRGGEPGVLHGMRVRDGAPMFSTKLRLGGVRFAAPLVRGERVYLSSCGPREQSGAIEALRIGASTRADR